MGKMHRTLPAAVREKLLIIQLPYIDAVHGFAQVFGQLGQLLGIHVVGGGFYNGFGHFLGIGGLEDARAYEYRFSP